MDTTATYTQDSLLDDAMLGSNPSAHYLESVKMLDNVVRECIHVSKEYSGIKSPTSRHYYASVLFTALITRGVSLAHLMPFSPWAEKKIEHWDYSSVAGITRTMLELRIGFFYLCVEECSTEEWDLRWNLFNLHDCVSRIRLFEASEETEHVLGFKNQADKLRERLKNNIVFKAFPEGQQRKLLNGQTAYLYSLEDIAEKAGIEKKQFRWLYVLFSSHVHGLPMSYYRIGEGGRGLGLPCSVEESYTSLCLSLASTFLVRSRDNLKELFIDVKKTTYKVKVFEESLASIEAKNDEVQTPNAMKVGESIMLTETDIIQIETTRLDESDYESVYRYKATGSIVLRRRHSEKNGESLREMDPFFWTIRINGKPATDEEIEELESREWAFKVDHVEFILSFKT